MDLKNVSVDSPSYYLIKKLSCLKSLVIQWERSRKLVQLKEICQIEDELSLAMDKGLWGSDQVSLQQSFQKLEQRKLLLLAQEEETWRLKSRALWIDLGNKNNIFFHKFVDNQRNQNSIWSLKTYGGKLVSSQVELIEEAATHFQKYYQDPGSCVVLHQIKVIHEFPHFLS